MSRTRSFLTKKEADRHRWIPCFSLKAEGRRFSGIEISLPTIGYIDVIDKTHIGSIGGLFLIEQILNSFVY